MKKPPPDIDVPALLSRLDTAERQGYEDKPGLFADAAACIRELDARSKRSHDSSLMWAEHAGNWRDRFEALERKTEK